MSQSVNFVGSAVEVTSEPLSRVPVADIVIVVSSVDAIELGVASSVSFPSGV